MHGDYQLSRGMRRLELKGVDDDMSAEQEGSHENLRKRTWLVSLGVPVPKTGCLVSFPGGNTGTTKTEVTIA